MIKMPLLEDAELGVSTFFARRHPANKCGSNGLPLTPNAVIMQGRFEFLRSVTHRNLCTYLKLVPARGGVLGGVPQKCGGERLMVVSEWYKRSLEDAIPTGELCSFDGVKQLAFNVLRALEHIHNLNIVHRGLSPSKIRLSKKCAKVHDFGMFYLTKCGATVSFCIGNPKYLAPEVLSRGPYSIVEDGPKVDIWSLGIILSEVVMRKLLWSELRPRTELRKLLVQVLALVQSEDPVKTIFEMGNCQSLLEGLDKDVGQLLRLCLRVSPTDRPTAHELLQHEMFTTHREKAQGEKIVLEPGTSCFVVRDRARCIGKDTFVEFSKAVKYSDASSKTHQQDLLAERSLREVLFWWQLAGGDLEQELKRHGLIRSQPPICSLPCGFLHQGETFGEVKDAIFRFDDTVIPLSLKSLRERLANVNQALFYPLLEGDDSLQQPISKEVTNLPIVIRERNIDYQFQRLILFQRLLEGYPYTRDKIIEQSRRDIPPPVRAEVWAALLHVKGDIFTVYEQIDKDTETKTDRQIEVDIPRCHQYDALLASPEGHQKFKRVLKAWVVSHPSLVYWQGLDSLAASFLWLNFNNEALAYASLSAFIPKYLYNFFLKDNSAIVQEYLAVFFQAVAFHDPQLYCHLEKIGFNPELYAIPWFLTMYTHVFPLDKIFHLWDTLLLYDSSFPILIGVSILMLLRETLLSFSFNECILLFSDMPDIDINRCLVEARRMSAITPRSCVARQHDNPAVVAPVSGVEPEILSLGELRLEAAPRISPKDVVEVCPLQSASSRQRPRVKSSAPLIIDVRSHEEFSQGHLPSSVNMPAQTAFTADGQLAMVAIAKQIASHKGLIIIVANRGNAGPEVGRKLVELGHGHVCVLRGGASYLRAMGVLTAFKDNE